MNDYGPLFEASGQQYNVDPNLLRAIMRVESGGNTKAVSSAGAQGPMQLMPATGKSLGVSDAFDPKEAIPAAAKLMAENLDRYGNVQDAVMAYHGGTDKANWGPKTQNYAQKIAAAYQVKDEPMAQTAPDLSGDPLWQAMNGKVKTSPQSGIDARLAGDPLWQMMNTSKGATAKEKTQSAPPAASTPDGTGVAAGAGVVGRVGRGFVRGFEDVADTGAKIASYGLDKTGLTPVLGTNSLEEVRRNSQNDRAQYEAQYGDSYAAGAGRLAGDIVASYPFLAGAGKALAAGGNALTGALAASPTTSGAVPALQATGRFLSGKTGEAGLAEGAPLVARVGNRLLQLASRGAAGASVGAGANALIGEDPKAGAIWGAAIPIAGGLLADVGRGVGRAAYGAVQPFFESGRAEIADDVIRQFAKGGPTEINAQEFIPGSQPTLAQATGNPGLATLERAVRDVRTNEFGNRLAANASARENALAALAGTPDTVDDLIASRSGEALPKLKAALAKTEPADVAPVVEKIDEILKSPAGQRDAVVTALSKIKSKIMGAEGPQTDAAQLYGIRQSITDDLSPLAERTGSSARLAASELMTVKDALDDAIEQAAPGYRDYLQTYSKMSKPVDAAEFLQSLNLTDTRGNITLGKVDSAIKRITNKLNQSGVNPAKSLSSDQLAALHSLRDDLLREGNSSLGKSIGSNTFQNLATNNLLAKAGTPIVDLAVGLHNPLLGLAMYAGKGAYRSQNDAILDALSQRLLEPSVAAQAFENRAPGLASQLANSPAVNRLMPYALPAATIAGTRASSQPRQ